MSSDLEEQSIDLIMPSKHYGTYKPKPGNLPTVVSVTPGADPPRGFTGDQFDQFLRGVERAGPGLVRSRALLDRFGVAPKENGKLADMSTGRNSNPKFYYDFEDGRIHESDHRYDDMMTLVEYFGDAIAARERGRSLGSLHVTHAGSPGTNP